MSARIFKNMVVAAFSQLKENLPDGEIFNWKKHVLPRLIPFLSWKQELHKPNVLKADFFAGLMGAIVVLPQAIAFALIAGLPPVYGLYAALIAPPIAALFGASMHLVSGPTTAISIVIIATIGKLAPIASQEYITLTLTLTFLVGAIQLGLGIGKMGRYIGFVSSTVVMGFTAGAAVLIITSQASNVLGIQIEKQASFLETWRHLLWQLPNTQLPVLTVALSTILAAVLVKKIAPKLPHLVIALAIGTGIALLLGGPQAGILYVEEMPSGMPPLSFPSLTPDNLHLLLSSAFALAVLGLVQAVAIAKTAALKTGQPLDANQEFIGQGLSNLIAPFFSGYASSGSFSRTALNVDAGAKTPMSTVFSTIILLLVTLFVAPYTRLLPEPAMAGLIILVGWNLLDLKHLEEVQRASREENIILAAVFFATLFSELQFAIYLGVLLSLYFYLKKTAAPNIALMAPDPATERHEIVNIDRRTHLKTCPQVIIIRIDGNLFFGAIQHVSSHIRELRKGPESWIILLANGINHVDLDGAEWLAEESKFWKEKKAGGMVIVRLKNIAQDVMSEGGFLDAIGRSHFFNSKTDAISWVYQQLNPKICESCSSRIFKECD